MSAFKIGDVVEWRSQSAGVWKGKIGQVVQVVPPRGKPSGVYNPGSCRSHESYVVSACSRRYWPRVSALRTPRAEELPPTLPAGTALPCLACGNLWDSWADFLAHRNGDGTCKPWPLPKVEAPISAASLPRADDPPASSSLPNPSENTR